MIGAATSNSGKTTFTIGLLRYLKNIGINVQPFKCGPDYIDPIFHRMASGKSSINLDTFMSSSKHINEIYNRYGIGADICITEGVMGLFDGWDKQKGSSAELAKMLNIPVLLVVNAESVAYSIAPLVYGFRHFDKELNIEGVVLNKVASEKHYQMLRDACKDAGVECYGYISRNKEITMPSRHLGLNISEKNKIEQVIQASAKEIEQHVDINKILGR